MHQFYCESDDSRLVLTEGYRNHTDYYKCPVCGNKLTLNEAEKILNIYSKEELKFFETKYNRVNIQNEKIYISKKKGDFFI